MMVRRVKMEREDRVAMMVVRVLLALEVPLAPLEE